MAKNPLSVEALKHDSATRRNIPTAEYESVMRADEKAPVQLAYERRNRDLDPQLVWRGKDEQDWSDLIVQAPPLYIQEKVHPKAIIDELKRESQARREEAEPSAPDLFADFNGLKDKEAATEFYQHDQHWSNRMISGDSLSVMASLAEREGLRGKVQCIYFDPPYGIRFNSNFQWSTTSRDVKDGAKDHLTREPEQVRAFRDTWKDGIHSYLTYLRDRLTVARDLLHESGSIFVQIGDENVHRVRALMDEVFGEENYVSEILVKKKGSQISGTLEPVNDFILMYARQGERLKFRKLWLVREEEEVFEDFPFVELDGGVRLRVSQLSARDNVDYERNIALFRATYPGARIFGLNPLKSGGFRRNQSHDIKLFGRVFPIGDGQCWKHTVVSDDGETPGMTRLAYADRLFPLNRDIRFIRYSPSPSIKQMSNWWDALGGASKPIYVVQTNTELIKRCILMATDPGDLVLDPTCGSGTTAYVAEHWGRRWITVDTSRVAIALARSRLMGARYPYYLLADSPEGQLKEGDLTRTSPKSTPTRGDIRHGFVYDRARSGSSGAIASNTEIDVIWEKWQATLAPLRAALNAALSKSWEEWEIPREAAPGWPEAATLAHRQWWEARIARQKEIDASIAAKAEFEYLYDRPYTDNSKVRVAGPFTVESLSPHRTLAVDWDDELIDVLEAAEGKRKAAERDETVHDFAHMILENLKIAGVQQAHKEDRITFSSLTGWPGEFICAEGTYTEGQQQKRAGIFIGPEFGTVSRPDLVAAAREAGDAGFDVLIACAFNYDAHSAEFDKLGRVPVLKARMNPDLHMGGDLKATGAGNLFVIFGEPDIKILDAADGMKQVKVFGVDVFKPQTGEVISEGTDGIALWMLDTDYNEESFFVRHAYFLGANDPYKALKTTLKAEIDQEAWESLNSDISRPFPKPKSGRIAVKVINHLGDEVMKVFAVN
ncbi:site-specific DNA-methyltransferase [Bosea sp. CS1GBMeth4]|uniref:site-specific DNA-methyltransferase n=1 Tax=Bosea sp. CS1GBMeth4 TaxID=1892849 RepID=UPI001646A1AF|nr:site-specific DNA-methyltransferase [Bosea sp. CS1GBMeth4]